MAINKHLRKSVSCVFSLLLAFVMIACLFPSSALAEATTPDPPAKTNTNTSGMQIEKK